MFRAMIARRMLHFLAGAALSVWPGLAPKPATAHPHIFVEAGLTFLFDDAGQLAAVQVLWAYDEFFSLLLIEDRGLDPDGDGVLTEAEKTALAGTDVDWDAGFPGDLHLTFAGNPVALGPAMEHRADYAQGRVATSHIRPLLTRIDLDGAGPLAAKVYDPTFFVAYDVTQPVTASRADCQIVHTPADLAAAQVLVAEMMSEQDYADDDYPEVGEAYADTFVLTCAAPS